MSKTKSKTKSKPSADALACMTCGTAVADPDAPIIEVDAYAVAGHRPLPGHSAAVRTYALSRCPECQALEEAASALLDAFPAVRERIGSRSIAIERVAGALAVADALQRPLPPMATAKDAWRVVAYLGEAGLSARLGARLAPFTTRDAPVAEGRAVPSQSRWQHLTSDDRRELQRAMLALDAARFAKPKPRACPPAEFGSAQGCAMCGAAAVMALQVVPLDALWTPATVSLASIGGSTPARRPGYLCPPCADAVQSAGSVGVTAMTNALLAHLGVRRMLPDGEPIDGIVGWLATGATEPNAEPWAHLDLASAREAAARL